MAQQQQQRYKVLEKIASGGMAEVFRAESAGLEGFKKTVAIKRVLPHLSEKKQFIGMFLDEARVSAQLSHSNCVQVFDIGVGDNTYFIVMEFVDGADLKAVIEAQKRAGQVMPVEEACLICVRICEGLAYAHELSDGKGQNLQIVHRDMSPPNVLLTRHGEVKIVDFGLAKANSQLERSEPGIIKGKFSYLSPEAAKGMPVDPRTDIFAVGIILWEMLAGRRLFLGETDLETVRQVQSAKVPPIRQYNPGVSAELEAIIARALAVDPDRRYQTARHLGRDLNHILFRQGRAVSSFEIAGLVEPLWRERATKRKVQQDKRSIIGTLIDEALFEFTSLQPGDRDSNPSQTGSAPLNIGSFGTRDWADDLGDLGRPLQTQEERPGLPSGEFEVGNLSALEEDAFSSRKPAPRLDVPPTPMVATPAAVAVPQSAVMPQASAEKSGGKGGMIALFVVFLLVAAGVGAYFGGLLPKETLQQIGR